MSMIKRFVIFAGHYYYPSGGWSDFQDSFDTQEEAVEAALHFYSIAKDWVQIIDLTTGKTKSAQNPKDVIEGKWL